MGNTKKYLDLEGLSTYHDELVQRLSDLEYDPDRMFETKAQLFNTDKWGMDKYGRLTGLKAGLIITVGTQIWQLVTPATFRAELTTVSPISEKVAKTPEQLGWKVVGNTVDFNVNNHVLELTK